MTDGKQYFNFEDVKKILTTNHCNSCHFDGSSNSKWRFGTYEQLITTGSCTYPVVKYGDAASSTLYQVLNGNSKVCFSNYSNEHNLNYLDKEKIENWINFGAPDDCIPLFAEIKSIFDAYQCQSCHNKTDKAGSWYYDTYSDLINDNGVNCPESFNIKLYEAENSLLYQKIKDAGNIECGQRMPIDGNKMSDKDVKMIRDWINSSAPFSQQSLPITLEYFNVTEISDEAIQLDWLTETEVNTLQYELERSLNGFEYTLIGTISPSGLGSGRYTFQDKAMIPGPNYYRLKTVDKDGRHDYSPIRFMYIKSADLYFKLYPNPTRSQGEININWYSKKDNQKSAYIELVSLSGKKISRYYIVNGINKIKLPTLSAGVYLLVLNDYFSSAHWERIIITE